ncbi:terpenoid synthase [Apiospora saccharicola]|uniref:Terpene synthase n=1 Tax=Apiospora saccharicola TaxID=335842 RepID=A0ABR1U663_9PEZI
MASNTDNRITIPDFMASWPSDRGWPWNARLHVDSDSIKAESEQWLRNYDGIDGTFVDKIIQGRFPDIACLIYGHQARDHCLLMALIMLHFFVIDEVTDHEEEAEVREKTEAMALALQSPGTPSSLSLEDTWVGTRMAADITTRYRETGTPASWKFFVDTFIDYLDGVADEAAARTKPILSRADYLALRTKTIGVLPGMAMALIDCELRDGFLDLPVVKSLMGLTVLILIHQNDMYSFDKEQARGEDGHNGVRVLMEERRIGVQAAMDSLGSETAGLVREFVRLCEDLPALEHETDGAHLRVLRDGCISWIMGMEVWYTQVTHRYGMQNLGTDRSYRPAQC